MINLAFLKKHTPRWIVLSIDVIISFISIVSAYFLRYNFELPVDIYEQLLFIIPFVLTIRLISYIISRTYAGIVRYTSTTDAVRIFIVISFGSVVLMLSNLVSMFYYGIYLIPYSVILIDFFIHVFLMTASRFFVKAVYSRLSNYAKHKVHVIVYGANDFALSTKKAIERETDANYSVVAFVDDIKGPTGKKLDGISIYPAEKLPTLLQMHKVSSLVIAKKYVDPDVKNQLIETCLNYYVKVFNVPQISEWINGELSFKQMRKIRIEDLLERDPIELDEEKIKEEVKDKTVLVTGAAGSIGSEIVRQLTRFAPKRVIIFDQAESPLYDLELELSEKQKFINFEIVIGDLTNKTRTTEVFKTFKPDVVYHAAAYKHVPMMENNPTEAIHNNIYGSKLVADLSAEYGVNKFVMISTDKAVNPTNIMGASKRIAEIYIQSLNEHSNTKFITTRFGNVLGSNGSVIPRFKSQIENGGPVTVTHPEITRFFMTIPEACRLVLEAGAFGKGGEIFIFDMGKSVKIVDLAKKMIKLYGLKLGRDIHLKFTGLRPGEKLYEELLADKENTMPTHHKQIMIGKVRSYDYNEIKINLEKLFKVTQMNNNREIVRNMKYIVPEFKSRNSVYEELDKEIEAALNSPHN